MHHHGNTQIILILSKMGYKDLAFRRARQFARVAPHFARVLLINPQLKLGCEPEFQALAQELQIDEARAAKLCRKAE